LFDIIRTLLCSHLLVDPKRSKAMNKISDESPQLARSPPADSHCLPVFDGIAPSFVPSLDDETFTTIAVPAMGFVNVLHVRKSN